MARIRFIDRDLGWRRMEQEIAKARNKPHVAVGVFGSKAAADHGGIPNIKVATTHEFGATINHPGGTAYFIGADGQAHFVSNAAAEGRGLPRTAPHVIKVPQRSFIRGTIDAKSRVIVKTAKTLMQNVLIGRLTTRRALETLGLFIQGQIRERMSTSIPPPLSPATIRRKTVRGRRGTTTLIDTGQLRASVDYKVKNV